MPYRWTDPEMDGAPLRLDLWPHQSLTGSGFSWFIGVTVAMFALPLFAVLGSPILWVLMGFFAIAVWGVWRAVMVNRARLRMTEVLELWPDRVRLVHLAPKTDPKTWEANPYWVEVRLTPEGGKVENYLTLKGGGREVELGAFLSPDERETLKGEVESALIGAGRSGREDARRSPSDGCLLRAPIGPLLAICLGAANCCMAWAVNIP